MSGESTTARTGSLRAAAARIGVSLPTLYKLIDSGKLRSYHVGRAHRTSDEAVRDCIALLEQEGRASSRGKS
jgi:excisionase family DNA binding protein